MRPDQTLRALPSYVTRLPKGNETGQFLALDLGGTNLRVCEVTLEGHGKFRMRQRKTPIPELVKTAGAQQFFDFIADFVMQFLDSEKINVSDYAMIMTLIILIILIGWTRGTEETAFGFHILIPCGAD